MGLFLSITIPGQDAGQRLFQELSTKIGVPEASLPQGLMLGGRCAVLALPPPTVTSAQPPPPSPVHLPRAQHLLAGQETLEGSMIMSCHGCSCITGRGRHGPGHCQLEGLRSAGKREGN